MGSGLHTPTNFSGSTPFPPSGQVLGFRGGGGVRKSTGRRNSKGGDLDSQGDLGIMHNYYQWPSWGLTPGTYKGLAWDLLTFVTNFWPRTGALNHFCTSEARYTGKDTQHL